MTAYVTEVVLTDYPDRDGLVVELWSGDDLFITLSEVGPHSVEVYPAPDGTPWTLAKDALIAAVNVASERLAGRQQSLAPGSERV